MVFRHSVIGIHQISAIFSFLKNRGFLVILILSMNISFYAQDEGKGYQWSPANKDRSADPYLLVGGDKDKMITVFREKRKNIVVKSYTYSSMKETAYNSFVLDGEPNIEEAVAAAFYLHDNVYFFIDQYSFKEKQQKLLLKTLNLANNSLSKTLEIDQIAKGKSNRRGGFKIELNNDSTHFIVLSERPKYKRENKSFRLKYFDLKLNELWQNEFNLPYGSTYTYVNQICGDNKGNAHLGIKVAPSNNLANFNQKDQSERKFLILSYLSEENRIKETVLNIGDKWVANMAFDLSENDEIVVSGFYSNNRFNSIAGTYYLRLKSDDLSVQASALSPLSEESIVDLIGKKKSGKGEEVPYVELRHIVVHDNGECSIIGEQFWTRDRNEFVANGGFLSRPAYYFMDLVLVRYLADGSIKWDRVVPKRQESLDDDGIYSSIALASKNDDLYIVFNDDEKNVEILNNPDYGNLRNFNISRSDPSYVRVDSNGNVSRQSPFKGQKAQYKLRPVDSIQSSKNHLVILASRNGTERFCVFDLNP